MTLIDPPASPEIGDIYQSRFWDGQKWQCPQRLILTDAPRDGNLWARQNGTWQRALPFNGGELLSLLIDYDLTVMGNAKVTGLFFAGGGVETPQTIYAGNGLEVIGTGSISGEVQIGGPLIVAQAVIAQSTLSVAGVNVAGGTNSGQTGASGNPLLNDNRIMVISTASNSSAGITTDGTGGAAVIGDVNGNINLVPFAWNADSSCNVLGDLHVGGVMNQGSDAILKENIHDMPFGLGVVRGLRPRDYNRKGSSRPEYGLIAQEVQGVMPYAVVPGKVLGLQPMALIAVLVNAVKELAGRLEKLENAT